MTGNVQINGIGDEQLVKILEVKLRNESYLNFNPQQMQTQQYQQAGKNGTFYNNVVLSWTADQGLAAVLEILTILSKKSEQTKAAGQ